MVKKHFEAERQERAARQLLDGLFGSVLLASVLTGGLSAGGSGAQVNYNVTDTDSTQLMNGQVDPTLIAAAIGVASMAAAFGLVIGLAFNFFVYGPIKIESAAPFFWRAGKAGLPSASSFTALKGEYIKNAAAMFLTDLFTALWSLLFIIPGIVKSLAWSQVPYLLAENPGMSGKRARELSDQMTMGHKWDLFVLGLSFIGWNLLGALACGVGVLFVAPYVQATYAEAYAFLRAQALEKGLALPGEFPGLAQQR